MVIALFVDCLGFVLVKYGTGVQGILRVTLNIYHLIIYRALLQFQTINKPPTPSMMRLENRGSFANYLVGIIEVLWGRHYVLYENLTLSD